MGRAGICASGIERDLITDDFFTRFDQMERELNRLTRTTATVGGSGGVGSVFGIPVGLIGLWSGAVADIPQGWQLADGTNGTVDLRNSFIVGAGDTYNPGDTGGADTVDISHQHGDGTLATDSDAHTHASGGYATDSDAHTHGAGGYATDTQSGHDHSISWESSHDHGDTDGPSSTTTWGNSNTPPGPAKGDGTHEHNIPSQAGHAHGAATGTAGSHDHDVTGSSGSDDHSHDVTGNSGSDAHSHDVTGSTATGGDTTHDNRPTYFALCFVMRIAV